MCYGVFVVFGVCVGCVGVCVWGGGLCLCVRFVVHVTYSIPIDDEKDLISKVGRRRYYILPCRLQV